MNNYGLKNLEKEGKTSPIFFNPIQGCFLYVIELQTRVLSEMTLQTRNH